MGASTRAVARWAALLGLGVFGVFSLMLAVGAASFVHECRGVVCAQLQQAVFALVSAAASLLAAARLAGQRPGAALITLVGTLPLLVVHVVLVLTDPDESLFFPVSTAPPPLLAGVVLLVGAARRRTRSGS